MNNKLVTVLFFFLASGCYSQHYLKGIVLYQNSGNTPAIGVSITAFGASPKTIYSSSDGTFIFKFYDRVPGDKVTIIVGETDNQKKKIEVINVKEIESGIIPSDPDANPLKIIVCPKGKRDEAAIKYYNIILKKNDGYFLAKIDSITSIMNQILENDKKIADLENEIFILRQDRDRQREEAMKFANQLASINKDQAPLIINQAIESLENGTSVDEALKILSISNLDSLYSSYKYSKEITFKQLNDLIEAYDLKINLLVFSKEFNEAIESANSLLLILNTENVEDSIKLNWNQIISRIYFLSNDIGKGFEFIHKSFQYTKSKNDSISIYFDFANRFCKYYGMDSAFYYLKKIDQLIMQDQDTLNLSKAKYYDGMARCYLSINALMDEEKKVQEAIFGKGLKGLIPLAMDWGNYLNYLYPGGYEKAYKYEIKAIEILKKCQVDDSSYLSVFFNDLSLILSGLNKNDSALKVMLTCIELEEKNRSSNDPQLSSTYCNFGYVLAKNKDFQGAIYYLEKALQIQMQSPVADSLDSQIIINYLAAFYDTIAFDFLNKGEFKKAREIFNKSFRIFPANDNTLFEIARCYFFERDYLNCIKYCSLSFPIKHLKYTDIKLNTLSGYDVRKTDQLYYLAISNSKLKNFKESQQYLDELQKLAPAASKTYIALTIHFLLLDKPKEAVKMFNKAIDCGFKDKQFLNNEDSFSKIRADKKFIELTKDL